MTMLRHLVALATLAAAAVGGVPAAYAQEGGDPITRDAVLRDPDIPAMGNPQGDITIVEWFDYQCPYCKKTAPVLARIVKADGKIRLVHKDWPIFGEVSFYAARMVLAAKYQDKYTAAHDAVMAATGKLSEDMVRQSLVKAGVNVPKATADLESHRKEIDALLARNNTQAEALGFNGTPSFIIGTFRVPGVLQEAGFKQAVADARKAAAANPEKPKPAPVK
jgi:protein-disulfide isomerase